MMLQLSPHKVNIPDRRQEKMTVEKTYVEQRDGGYWVAGTRVSLDSLVYAFRRGASPETIRRSFPVLTLEEVYGAIAFYLAHEPEVDVYLEESEREFETQTKEINARTRAAKPELFERLESTRRDREATRR
jgi:uncharacterized protein (DUF433 family)